MTAVSTKRLVGQNFSGRSNWLSARRLENPWPKCTFVGPNPDTAFTGLASKVYEEIVIAGCRAALDASQITNLLDTFELQELRARKIHMLSGGESVRLAFASTAAQCAGEMQVDTALEQLDLAWRAKMLRILKTDEDVLPLTRIVADNHLTPSEAVGFTSTLEFPIICPPVPAFFENTIDVNFLRSLIRQVPNVPLTLEGLSYWYDRASARVLHDVNLKLEPGRLYILSGANGSGKTTLVKLLSGTLRPRHGTIRFGVEDFRPDRRTDRFASLAFQNPDYQWTRASVGAQIGLAMRAPFNSLTEAQILSLFAMSPAIASMHPVDLKYVFKKRLGIALALIDTKPWAIFDEPTLGQDERFASSLAASFGVAMRAGRGIILISHDNCFKSRFQDFYELILKDGAILIKYSDYSGGKNDITP